MDTNKEKDMKKLVFAAFAFVLCASSAYAKVNVFACQPEWASLTGEIAGDRVSIFTATTAQQDPHTVAAKPSLIAQIRKADLVIGSGAELEIGWLPMLLQQAGASSIQMGGENNIMAAGYVKRLEVPERIDRSMGDVHPEGNPHVHLNPNNLLALADRVLARLAELDPSNKPFFEERHAAFQSKLKAKIKEWEKLAAPLAGMALILNHPNMTYLCDWLGIVVAGALEPKPGVPPTSRHLTAMVDIAKKRHVRLIGYVPFENPQAAKWLSDQTGIPYVEMPYTVGGGGTADLFSLFEKSIQLLLAKRGS